MIQIHNQESLVATLKVLKRKAKYARFPHGGGRKIIGISFGSAKEKKEGVVAWTSYHTSISFRGEDLHVKIFKPSGYFALVGRLALEALFNDAFLVHEQPVESFQRESETYRSLNEQGFPTLHSRQELLLDAQGNQLISGVILTTKIKNRRNSLDLMIQEGPLGTFFHAGEIAAQMRQLHSYGLIWGDAVPQNVFYDCDGNLVLHDFGFLTNNQMPIPTRQGKDLITLTMSIVGNTGYLPGPITDAVIGGYQPPHETREALGVMLERDLSAQCSKTFLYARGKLYYRPFFLLDHFAVTTIKKKMLSHL